MTPAFARLDTQEPWHGSIDRVGKGDDTSPDAAATANANQVQLRAEASPQGDGRVYRIGYTVSDGNGGTCTGEEKVSVPRKKGGAAVDSAPPSYNSFGP